MRKMLMVLFVTMMFSILAMPAFAQTGDAAHGGTNWVGITAGIENSNLPGLLQAADSTDRVLGAAYAARQSAPPEPIFLLARLVRAVPDSVAVLTHHHP